MKLPSLHQFSVGDLVKYSWRQNECGIVLAIGAPYQRAEECLYVLWNKPESSRVRWWVPIDSWIIKC